MSFSPTATAPPTAPQPVLPTQVKPIVVDNNERPVSQLRGYLEGMRLVVHYYRMVTDKTQATYGHDTGKSRALQQYVKIERLELVMDGDLQSTQDTKDKTFITSGDAFFDVPGVVPNAGDLFSMDVGNGRVGVMQVNTSERITAMNDSAYRLQFTQLFYASDARYADMESKVVQTMHYMRDYLQFGKDPVVTDTVFSDLKSLSRLKDELIRDYVRAFTNHNHKLLMVPGQSTLTHDPYTALAFRKLVNVRTHPEVQELRFLNNGVDDQLDQPTLWDVLLQRRPELLIGCRDRSHSIHRGMFRASPMLRSLRYSGADTIVFPYSRTPSLEDREEGSFPWQPEVVFSPGGPLNMMARAGSPSVNAAELVPLHPVSKDGFYILSEGFYTNDASKQSLLDKLVWDYLQGEGISSRDLHYLVSNHRAWSAPDRYFYVPIILVLIQASLLDAG